jgi:hypothetical protein
VLAEAVAALVGTHPHGLDGRAGHALAGQAGRERQLQRAHDLVAVDRHGQVLVRVGVDHLERLQVGGVARLLPLRAERVVGQHRHDRVDIGGRRPPDCDLHVSPRLDVGKS